MVSIAPCLHAYGHKVDIRGAWSDIRIGHVTQGRGQLSHEWSQFPWLSDTQN